MDLYYNHADSCLELIEWGNKIQGEGLDNKIKKKCYKQAIPIRQKFRYIYVIIRCKQLTIYSIRIYQVIEKSETGIESLHLEIMELQINNSVII